MGKPPARCQERIGAGHVATLPAAARFRSPRAAAERGCARQALADRAAASHISAMEERSMSPFSRMARSIVVG